MGFPIDMFVEQPVDDEFMCSICHGVFDDPVRLNSGCDHYFCRNCINNWKNNCEQVNCTCPLDRKVFTDVIDPPTTSIISLVNRLNKLHCNCRFINLGCFKITTVCKIVEHEKYCRFNPNTINYCRGKCGAKIRNVDQGSHECVEYLKSQERQLRKQNAVLEIERKVEMLENTKLRRLLVNKWQEIDELKELLASTQTATTKQLKPDGIYAECVYDHPIHPEGGNLYLDLKVGEVISIEKQNFGQISLLANENGIKGLVRVDYVQPLNNKELMEGFQVGRSCTRRTSIMTILKRQPLIIIICFLPLIFLLFYLANLFSFDQRH